MDGIATNGFLLFNEQKANMLSQESYQTNPQRLLGVQAGVASSQLQNKAMYQSSLMVKSIAQLIQNQGTDINDSMSVDQVSEALYKFQHNNYFFIQYAGSQNTTMVNPKSIYFTYPYAEFAYISSQARPEYQNIISTIFAT